MFCIHCGKEVADDAAFCPHCGGALKAEEKKVEKEPFIKQESIDKAKESIEGSIGKAKETAGTINWKEPDFLKKVKRKQIALASGITSGIAFVFGILFTIMAYLDWAETIGHLSYKRASVYKELASVAHALLIIGIIVMVLVAVVVLWKYLTEKDNKSLYLAGAGTAEAIILGLQFSFLDWFKDLMEWVSNLAYRTSDFSGSLLSDIYNVFSYGEFYSTVKQMEISLPSGFRAILLIIVAILTLVASANYTGKEHKGE